MDASSWLGARALPPLFDRFVRERPVALGLELLPYRHFASALEVSFGSRAVLPAPERPIRVLRRIDLDADAGWAAATDLPSATGRHDLVVSFSVLQHLAEYDRVLDEMTRVLAPRGWLLLGMPAAGAMAGVARRAAGIANGSRPEVTTPAAVAARFNRSGLRVAATAHVDLPFAAPLGVRVYWNWLLQKI